MEKIKNIFKTIKKVIFGILFGGFGFALSLCIAPIAVVGIIFYMTKISAEAGYKEEYLDGVSDKLDKTTREIVKDKLE